MTTTVWAALLYSVSLAAELGGIAILVADLLRNRVEVRERKAANPNNNEGGSWLQMNLLNNVMLGLIGVTRWRILAVALLVVGVITGGIGNFVTL